jgi:hypothetical protein
MSNIYASHYTTSDEINFLTGMLTGKAHVFGNNTITHGWSGRGANPEGFRRYAETVLSGMRTYPPTVNAERIKAWIRAALADMPAATHPAVLAPDGDMDGAAE